MTLQLKMQREVLLMNLEQQLQDLTQEMYKKSIADCTDEQLYVAILQLTKGLMDATAPISGDKKIYYISAEFLIGKLLSNNLINLGVYEKLEDILKANGKELSRIVSSNKLLRCRTLVNSVIRDLIYLKFLRYLMQTSTNKAIRNETIRDESAMVSFRGVPFLPIIV